MLIINAQCTPIGLYCDWSGVNVAAAYTALCHTLACGQHNYKNLLMSSLRFRIVWNTLGLSEAVLCIVLCLCSCGNIISYLPRTVPIQSPSETYVHLCGRQVSQHAFHNNQRRWRRIKTWLHQHINVGFCGNIKSF